MIAIKQWELCVFVYIFLIYQLNVQKSLWIFKPSLLEINVRWRPLSTTLSHTPLDPYKSSNFDGQRHTCVYAAYDSTRPSTGTMLSAKLTWWRHQMETFSALLALCVGNSPVTGEFPTQRPVMRSFDVFFVLRLNKRLSKFLRRHRAHYDVIVMGISFHSAFRYWIFSTQSIGLEFTFNKELCVCLFISVVACECVLCSNEKYFPPPKS